MATFKSYKPAGSYARPQHARACEACYARKVRCDISGSTGSCSNCVEHGFSCRPRSRRRKEQSLQPPPHAEKTIRLGQRLGPRYIGVSNPATVRQEHQQAGEQQQQQSWNFVAPSSAQSLPRVDNEAEGAASLAQPSLSFSAPHLFIYNHESVAAAAMSPVELVAAACSPHLDEFYNSSYLSRRAVLGDDFPDIDHSHHHSHGGRQQQPPPTPHEHILTDSDMKVLELYHAFDLPSIPVRQALFEIFHERCWTWMPVVDFDQQRRALVRGVDEDEDNEETSLADSASQRAATPTSLLVLQAILLAATSTRAESNGILPAQPQYRRIKALIDTCAERNPLNLLVALSLMQFYAPAAPKDISTDTPRFWGTYALGLAQQMGLNNPTPPSRRRQGTSGGSRGGGQAAQEGLRRRVWWTLYARDSIMSSAHGRPRIVNPADCGVEPPSIYDFPDPEDLRAQIFVSYVSITSIMCDLCRLLTRQNDPSSPVAAAAAAAEKSKVALRLLDYVRSMPPELRLVDRQKKPKPYSFDLAQLHVHLLTTIIILYRPRSIFHVPPTSAPAVVASNLNFRIFEAMELRGHTCFLSSGFSWHLLVTAIPQLSCLGVPALHREFGGNLDILEGVMRTLGATRPSAANNLRNIQVIRRALESKNTFPSTTMTTTTTTRLGDNDDVFSFNPLDLFDPYGVNVPENYRRISAALADFGLEPSPDDGGTVVVQDVGGTTLHEDPNVLEGVQAQSVSTGVPAVPTPTPYNNVGGDEVMVDFAPELLGSDFPEDGWMRNWIDELNLFGE